MMQSYIIDEAEMDASRDASIREGLCACFPADREVFSKTRAWHNTPPHWTVALEDEARVVAHVGVVERTISVGDESLRVAGVLNVFVLPSHHGQGLCRKVMQIAMDEAARRGLDFGLLFCTPQIGEIYLRMGWRQLASKTILRIDDDGRRCPIPAKNIALLYPVNREQFPLGDVDLQGNDW